MIAYEDAARRMAEGGYVRMQEGGTPTTGGMFGEFNPDNMVTDPGIGAPPLSTPIEQPTGTGELAGDLNTIQMLEILLPNRYRQSYRNRYRYNNNTTS